jgi:hypothetical protein
LKISKLGRENVGNNVGNNGKATNADDLWQKLWKLWKQLPAVRNPREEFLTFKEQGK